MQGIAGGTFSNWIEASPIGLRLREHADVSLRTRLQPWLVLLSITRATPLNCRAPIASRWRSSGCCISYF